MAAQLEIKQHQVFAARAPLIELIHDDRNREEQQEALEDLLSLHYSCSADEATRNCVSFTSDNNREVTYHWFPQLKEGTNMSETFRKRMPVHEFNCFLTKVFDSTTNCISVLLDTLLLVNAHAYERLLLEKGHS